MAFSFEKRFMIPMLMILGTLAPEVMSLASTEDDVTKTFQQWMSQHGRFYQDVMEKEKRLKIFKDNVEYVENFNSQGNRTYKLSLNKFADLTEEEFLATYTGHKMSTPGPETNELATGNTRSCWTFSAAAAVEGITANGVSLSAQQLLDCDTVSGGCNGGWRTAAFKYVIKNQGITSEDNYRYVGQRQTCRDKNVSSSSAKITGYQTVTSNSEQDLKVAVARQPVSVGITTCQNFQMYKSGVFQEDCGTKLDHAVLIVGYGTTEGGQKYWLIKNSWGKNWGENGYMRLERDVVSKEGLCGIAMEAAYPTL